jgi:hypothetical protein
LSPYFPGFQRVYQEQSVVAIFKKADW